MIPIYLETGAKRTFACAVDWPGWSRSGGDDASALQALLESAGRYAKAVEGVGIAFTLPVDLSDLKVVERLEGNATTDFGAPNAVSTVDRLPLDTEEPERQRKILQASWLALDAAEEAATGKELRKGPRGGGRDLERLLRHVVDSSASYLSRIGVGVPGLAKLDLHEARKAVQEAMLEGLGRGARGMLPERGPRGGEIWPVRVFVRREAWHVLDHAWEIEDRIV